MDIFIFKHYFGIYDNSVVNNINPCGLFNSKAILVEEQLCISTLIGYLMPNPSLRDSSGTIQPITGGITGFMPFPRVLVRKWA